MFLKDIKSCPQLQEDMQFYCDDFIRIKVVKTRRYDTRDC
jgi:hypothetical protein